MAEINNPNYGIQALQAENEINLCTLANIKAEMANSEILKKQKQGKIEDLERRLEYLTDSTKQQIQMLTNEIIELKRGWAQNQRLVKSTMAIVDFKNKISIIIIFLLNNNLMYI
jgi:hypothetical protein